MRFAHQPQHPRLRRAHSLEAQPRPHFAMPLAIKRRGRQYFADFFQQCSIAPSRLWSPPSEHSPGLCGDFSLIVKTGTRHLPCARDTHHAVTSSREGRSGAAHGFGLRQTKGRPASRRWIFSRSSSLLMLRSATSDFSPCVSSLSTSASLAFKFAAPPSSNSSRPPHTLPPPTPTSPPSFSR